MIKKLSKSITLLFLSLFFCFLSYKLCYFVAEKYFFDQFFYQKSIKHGYWVPSKQPSLRDFGNRARDIISLQSENKIIKTPTDRLFVVTIIGDSYVWGTGIKNNQRFSKLLETKLNRIRPTKVISLAQSGDSTLNYHDNYLKLLSQVKPDLSVFTLVPPNDILPKSQQIYTSETQNIVNECQKLFPQNTLTTNINPTDNPNIFKQKQEDINEAYLDAEKKASTNPINLCVMENVIKQLPTNNALYFIPGDYYDDNTNESNNAHYLYKNLLNKYNKFIITPSPMRNYPKYSQYWIKGNPYQFFHISQKEGHPNPLANQLYADLLYQEITTNSKWGFIK